MKKKSIITILLLLISTICFAQEKQESEKKDEEIEVPFFEISPSVKSVTTVELGFTDTDDGSNFSPALTKSSPAFEEELSAFIQFNRYGFKQFVFGPYGFYDGEMKFRRNDIADSEISSGSVRTYFLLKKINGFGGAGFRVGLQKEKKEFKGSSLFLSVPFALFYDINDKDDIASWEAGSSGEADYFTFFYIGSGVELGGTLKSKSAHLELSLNNRFLFGFEPYAVENRNDSVYLYERLNAEIAFAPFDFFCKEVNLKIEAGDKLEVFRNTYHIQVKNRVWLGLSWKPVKYFKLITQPFYFKTDCKFDVSNTDSYYDWTERIYGKYAVYFGSDSVGFELAVYPDYWAAYRENIKSSATTDADSIKTVKICAELTLKY